MAKRNGAEPAGGLDTQVYAGLDEARRRGRDAQQEAERAWQMPPIRIGNVVLWSTGEGDDQPCAALVVGVGDRTIAVKKEVKGHVLPENLDGVRHRDDPAFLRSPDTVEGCWDYTLGDRELMSALDTLNLPYLNNDAAQLRGLDDAE
jgi:hypothetical protein